MQDAQRTQGRNEDRIVEGILYRLSVRQLHATLQELLPECRHLIKLPTEAAEYWNDRYEQ